MTTDSYRGFAHTLLKEIQRDFERVREQWNGGELRHMLVFAPEKSLQFFGDDWGGSETTTTFEFEGLLPGTELPPPSLWPRGAPARAIAIESHVGFNPRRVPNRVHLFFGAIDALPAVQHVAQKIWDIRKELRSEMFPGQLSNFAYSEIILETPMVQLSNEVRIIDSWMRTVHWWCIYATELHGFAETRVPTGNEAITVRPRELAFKARLSFSLLKVDVFEATAAILNLFLKFYDDPPVNQNRGEPYPRLKAKPPPAQGQESELPERIRMAWTGYKHAEHALALTTDEKVTDDSAYDYLVEHRPDDLMLPDRDTWKRYVREARRTLDQRKNSPRAGRTSRNVRKADET